MLMSFISSMIKKHQEKKQEIEFECDSLISEIYLVRDDIESLFSDKDKPIDPNTALSAYDKCCRTIEKVKASSVGKARKALNYNKLQNDLAMLISLSRSLKENVQKHNDRAAAAKAESVYQLIGNVEGRKLDRQQLICIAKNEHNHLVIAGAGTGKTTTVVGKIKYLLKSEQYKPEDILVLSFTNASASEMSERIAKETGCSISASTFHKLGMNIIAAVDGKRPVITDLKMRSFIKEQLSRNMADTAYLKKLFSYIYYGRSAYKSEFDFSSQKEYDDYLRQNPPTTMLHETVKSYGEMDIANFLYLNSIRYEYEKAYKYDTANEQYGQYFPDFYLPDHDIYIEYFGIDRNSNVPSYFHSEYGMTPSQTYNAGIAWKRETHKNNGTKMIECYAYEKFESILLDELGKKLKAAGVKLEEKPPQEMWAMVSDNDKLLNGIYELFETCINLIKSNNYTINNVYLLSSGNPRQKDIELILSLLEPIYNAYCEYLERNHQIDFNDMINLATSYIRDGKYKNPYRYVIVDEYQDISKSRYLLLKALRDSMDYDLFCVGDDWQSIYRFAGSDIGYILNFERFWGASEKSKIETTYRFPKKLIDISGRFIMTNPMQIKKNIKAANDSTGFPLGEINAYTDNKAIEFMVERLNDLPKNSSVFFIGRYAFDVELLNKNPRLGCRYNNSKQVLEVFYNSRPDLKMQFITAHRSKGLQADYIFILNNKNSKMGFPSKIQDSAILDLLLESRDNFPYAEERRLFYVAMTRAKKKAYLLTVTNYESEFVKDIKHYFGEEMKQERFECPLCGGKLVRKKGPYGEFYGCSNYRITGCRFIRKIYSSPKQNQYSQ